MLVLAALSLLFFYITYFTGAGVLAGVRKWLGLPLAADFLGVFFTGLMASYIYFNIASFFVPVSFIVLLPLLLFSTYIFLKAGVRTQLIQGISNTITLFFNRQNSGISFGFLLILFLFWIIPPGNWDSSEYHYIAIRWYEKYAVVPGLANVHSRLAFNPANFIISAAYAFTHAFGQSVYPVNGVIQLLYYTWLLRLVYQQVSPSTKTILLAYAVLVLRNTLINITSPSSDMLVAIVISYCAIQSYQFIKTKSFSISNTWIIILLCAFGVCAKLSAIPTLLLIPFLWFCSKPQNKGKLFWKTAIAIALLWLPWLLRNMIMSGYLMYPIAGTNLIPFDWTIPKEVLLLDDFYTKYTTRNLHEPYLLATMNLPQLIVVWIKQSIRYHPFPFVIAMLSLVLPPLLLVYAKLRSVPVQKHLILLTGIYYLAALVWVVYAPEFRFGMSILQLLLLFTLLEWPGFQAVPGKWQSFLQAAIVLFAITHFSYDFVVRPTNDILDLKTQWLLPVKDYRYKTAERNNFPYVPLQNGTRLYLSDSTHHCLNADMPCMSWRYGDIEMRGTTIQQGFRNIKNEVRKFYPWLPR